MDESTASVFSYAYDKVRELRQLQEPRTVAFVDIGHTKATVTIAQFYVEEEGVLNTKILI